MNQTTVNGSTTLFCDYYKQWITVYKEGAIRPVTMNKYHIKDKEQTVTITEKPESPTTPDEPSTPTRTGTSPKTGDNTPFVALFAMMGSSAAGLIFAGYKRFRRVKKSK